MSDALPKGHISIDGEHYVHIHLFDAANEHVLAQGIYHNQLTATADDTGRLVSQLQAEVEGLKREKQALRDELVECRRVQVAMRSAVYGAGESL